MSTPTRSSDTDLTKYLPDPETAEAATAKPASYNQELSRPELLDKLSRLKTSPEPLKPVQPSTAAYVAPRPVTEQEAPTLPTARVKVEAKGKGKGKAKGKSAGVAIAMERSEAARQGG